MNDPVTYIRSEDMLDESRPERLARSFGLTTAATASRDWRSRSCCYRC